MKKLVCLIMILTHLAACATYQNQSVSFRPPQDYTNFHNTMGLMVGAESFVEKAQAEEAFGFDVRGAGLLPLQLVMDNKSGQSVEVVSGQTFLVDDTNRYWKLLTNREAAERVQRATESGVITSGAGKGAAWGAAAGAILGLALGIVSGHNVGEAVIKGGVLGGAGGAIIGGASKSDDRRQEYQIANDIREKGIEGKIMREEALATGFIFFPGEVKSAKELRLQLRFRGDNKIQTITLKLK